MSAPTRLLTLRVRVKDRQASLLRRMAREVNTVWNILALGHQSLEGGIPAV